MVECSVCGRKMPPHILIKHIAKSHPEEGEVKETHLSEEPRWDWQKTERCATCGQEHPALLMVYHAHIKHGV